MRVTVDNQNNEVRGFAGGAEKAIPWLRGMVDRVIASGISSETINQISYEIAVTLSGETKNPSYITQVTQELAEERITMQVEKLRRNREKIVEIPQDDEVRWKLLTMVRHANHSSFWPVACAPYPTGVAIGIRVIDQQHVARFLMYDNNRYRKSAVRCRSAQKPAARSAIPVGDGIEVEKAI